MSAPDIDVLEQVRRENALLEADNLELHRKLAEACAQVEVLSATLQEFEQPSDVGVVSA